MRFLSPPSLCLYFTLCCSSLFAAEMTWAAEAGLEQSTACRYCSRNFASQLRPSASGRQYAPDRKVDLLHMKLDVTPDLKNRTIEGTCQLLFTPIAKPLRELVLSAVDLDVQSVTSNVKLAGYEMTSRGLEVAFQEPVEVGKRVELDIRYEAEPRKGLYFRTPELGFREQDTHIWTQGEPHESRHWFPSIDYPNERFTSEIICHVPSQWTVLSNGRLVEEVAEPAGRKRVHYHQEIPHVGYLVALAAGDFAKLEDKHENIPLGFYTPRSRARYARNGFRDTADILGFLEAEIGVPYPWSKYDQVVVEDYHMGGMENTSLTILNPIAVFPDESENLRDLYGLIAHELVHQWFGDYLTCKDWSELWLNEGFAVYYSYLYDGYKNGNDSMLLSVYNDRKGILYNKDETRPVVFRHYDKAWDQFDQRAYAKGGWILHMLRMQLGEDLFRRCVTHYVKKNALRSVDTHDLQEAFEDVSGLSLLPFFDQWVHHAGHPKLEVAYDWLPHEKLAKISVEQLQQARSGDKQGDPKKKNQQQLFDLPVTLRFVGPDYTVERSILIDKQMQDFYVPLPEKPEVVRFDAKMQVLGEIDFEKPKKMLYRQLKEQGDVVGRLLAADALGEKDDQKTIKQLQTALVEDPFFGVRIEAAKSLAKIGTPEALDALAASLAQHDARVRRQVVRDIGSFYHPRARAALIGVLANEKNPDIVADAIRPLGKYSDAEVADQIRALLPVSSYDNAVAGGAMDAIRKLDDPGYIPLMQQVIEREVDYPSKTFPASLDALAHVARDLEDRDQVLEFLMAYLNHPRERVQLAAISALGTLGDPRAMEIVRSFNTGPEGNRKKKAAIEALKKLRDKQKTPAALGELRGEVDKLREQNEKFRTEVEDLKDRLEAADSREEENQEAEQQND